MKPTYEELEAKCKLQQEKLDAVNTMMEVVEQASALVKEGIKKLEDEKQALAAENVGLKKTLTTIANSQEFHGDTVVCDFDTLVTAAWSSLQTPATDRFGSEMKAQGVEMLTGKLQQLIDEGNFEGNEIGLIAGAVYTGADIAKQLREVGQ